MSLTAFVRGAVGVRHFPLPMHSAQPILPLVAVAVAVGKLPQSMPTVVLVHALVDVAFREDRLALSVLFVPLKLPSIHVPVPIAIDTRTVLHVVAPVTFVFEEGRERVEDESVEHSFLISNQTAR